MWLLQEDSVPRYRKLLLASCSKASQTPGMNRTSAWNRCLNVVVICPTLTSGETQDVKEIDLSERASRVRHGRKLVCPKPYRCSPGPGRNQLGCRRSSPGSYTAVDSQRAFGPGGR